MTNDASGSHYEHFIQLLLTSPHIDEGRSKELATVDRCVRLLQDGDGAWDVMFAICTHLEHYHYDDRPQRANWAQEAEHLVIDTVFETAFPPPSLPSRDPYGRETLDPVLSRYFHSRVAAGLLVEKEQASMAQRFLEEAYDLLATDTKARFSIDIEFAGATRVRSALRRIYESLEDYERALDMHLHSGIAGARPEFYDRCEAYLTGWLFRLMRTPSNAAAIDLLDSALLLMEETEGFVDQNLESLADSPRNTRQYWSWFCGLAVGRLIIPHPYLKDALIQEVRAGEWPEGWPVISLLVEECKDWAKQRDVCRSLYEAADVDYKGSRPYNAVQPAHLSPQSDLYWAMRIGFCDAHMDNNQGSEGLSTQELGEGLEDVRQMLSSIGLRSLRSLEGLRHDMLSLTGAIPTEGAVRLVIAETMGRENLDALPQESLQHLIEARLARLQGRPDDARAATAKAIESIFTRVVRERLMQHDPDLRIRVRRPTGGVIWRSVKQLGRMQLRDWGTVLADLNDENGCCAALAQAFATGFPAIDLQALALCSQGLVEASIARGQAAHDADRESYEVHTNYADNLWDIAVGDVSSPGLLSRLCSALGLSKPREP